MSLVDVINKIVATLLGDKPLNDFVREKWKRPLKVDKVFRDRQETSLADLPLLMVTRPFVKTQQENEIAYERMNTVKVFGGFRQERKELALEEMIQFEELIESALVQSLTLGGLADLITPGDSANSQGWFHPSYFIEKNFIVQTENVWRS